MTRMLESLKSIVFPDLCVACRTKRPKVDEELCRACLAHLPFVQLPEDAAAALAGKEQFPEMVSKFYSLFYYTKDSYVAEMIHYICLLYTSPSPRDQRGSRMPSSA